MSNVVSFPNHVCCLRIYSTIISVSPESMYNLLPRSTKKITPKEDIGTDKRTAASKGRQTRWLKTAIFCFSGMPLHSIYDKWFAFHRFQSFVTFI